MILLHSVRYNGLWRAGKKVPFLGRDTDLCPKRPRYVIKATAKKAIGRKTRFSSKHYQYYVQDYTLSCYAMLWLGEGQYTATTVAREWLVGWLVGSFALSLRFAFHQPDCGATNHCISGATVHFLFSPELPSWLGSLQWFYHVNQVPNNLNFRQQKQILYVSQRNVCKNRRTHPF